MTVGDLMNRIDSRELTEWSAYERVAGPLGPERDDLHTAMICTAITNAMKGKGPDAKPEDFMPVWDEADQTPDGRRRPRPQTPEEQIAAAQAALRPAGPAGRIRR